MDDLVGQDYAKSTLKRFQVLERHIDGYIQRQYKNSDLVKEIVVDAAVPRPFPKGTGKISFISIGPLSRWNFSGGGRTPHMSSGM